MSKLRPFQPGQSGNPGGRPAVAREFRERCRAFMEAQGAERLIGMSLGRGPFAFRALELLAGYAYGKPTQRTELSGADGGPIQTEWRVLETVVFEALESFPDARVALADALGQLGGDGNGD